MSQRNSQDKSAQILTSQGPLLSGQLSKLLVERGLAGSEVNARKLIERSRKSSAILSTDPVRFNQSYLCYVETQKLKKYPEAVRKVLHHRPPLKRVFVLTLANKGYISLGQLSKIGNCSTGTSLESSKRLTADKLLSQALAIGILESVDGMSNFFQLGHQFGRPSVSRNGLIKRLEMEDVLLHMVCEWFQHCYLLPPNARSVRESFEVAESFNHNWWDIHGPVYIGSAPSKKFPKAQPSGFLIADVISYRQVKRVDVDSFIERVTNIRTGWKDLSFFPVVVGSRFSQDAWKRLRSFGVATVTLSDVLGKHMIHLLRLFEEAVAAKTADELSVAKIADLLEMSTQPGVADGLLGNLRGAIFELIVAMYYKNQGYEVILQKFITKVDENLELEIDVAAFKGDKLIKLVECKGRQAGVTEGPEEINRHFQKRLPAAMDSYGWNVGELYRRVDAVFITLGEVPADLVPKQPKGGLKEQGVNRVVIQREQFLKMLDDDNEQDLRDLVKRFF